ncbi:MAG: proteasome assembly chaperone family protein [Candidatus Hadarchaeales archaeon]
MMPELPEAEIVETKKVEPNHPLLVLGFIGPGLVGSIAVSHLVKELKMEEIAHLRSKYLPPVAVFLEGKLHHPFRIYSTKDGRLLASFTEIPIPPEGFYPIASTLLEWAEGKGVGEVVVLEGLPVEGLPVERPKLCVAEEERCKALEGKGVKMASQGVIAGIAGAILNECLNRKITGIALLTPAILFLPDAEGAAVLLEALSEAFGLKVDVSSLREQGKEMEKRLEEMANAYRTMKARERMGPETIYG